ncbi:hypothetical protein AC578_8820 [Pseudocercospora eumusae]|uniref:Uncharacterized protein n=1 Tax=Pseudocercospora eumusae TaxID=321146 RepID=A0A139H4Q8_9PEZI|nr:hypothetical protein AC578_8820 [Pseudocercospora eumusae]
MLRKALKESKQAVAVAGQNSSPPVDEISPRRNSYYWHGHRYEFDENTKPEWIDAGRRKLSPSSTLTHPPSQKMSAPIVPIMSSVPSMQPAITTAPMPATQRLVPPVAQVVNPFAASSTAPSQPSILLPSTRIPWKTFLSFDREIRNNIYRHSMPTHSVIQLDWENGPPYLSPEPVFASLGLPLLARECLEVFFAENEFECPFHTTLYKFLTQLPGFVLPHLRTVRLSHPLTHAGYVRTLLVKLNERRVDGLRAGVVKVAMTVEGEEEPEFVGLEDLKDFFGIEGGLSGLKVARRKVSLGRERVDVMDLDEKGPKVSPAKRQQKKSKKLKAVEDEQWTGDRRAKPKVISTVSASGEEDEQPVRPMKRKRKKTSKAFEDEDYE